MGYTKLFSEIVMSTIWREPDHIRLLWVTLLALKDHNHEIMASVPGLADAARISLEECEHALDVLLSPDPYSRNKAEEGRRIREIPGGWEIINGDVYRQRMSDEEQREKNRRRQQRWRDKKKQAETGQDSASDSFLEFWGLYPRKETKKKAESIWRKMPDEKRKAAIADVPKRYRDTPKQYVPHPTTYLNQERWQDELTERKENGTFKSASDRRRESSERLDRRLKEAVERENNTGKLDSGAI